MNGLTTDFSSAQRSSGEKVTDKALGSLIKQRNQAISSLQFQVKLEEPKFAKKSMESSQPVLASLPKDLDRSMRLGDKESVNPLPPMSMVLQNKKRVQSTSQIKLAFPSIVPRMGKQVVNSKIQEMAKMNGRNMSFK